MDAMFSELGNRCVKLMEKRVLWFEEKDIELDSRDRRLCYQATKWMREALQGGDSGPLDSALAALMQVIHEGGPVPHDFPSDDGSASLYSGDYLRNDFLQLRGAFRDGGSAIAGG